MHCPKCSSTMNVLDHPGDFTVHKCGSCSALWFPEGSAGVTRALGVARSIDTGSESGFDQVRDIQCPECKTTMIKMVDKQQHHIHFESCGSCGGVLLDAGEVDDMSEFTLLERIQQALGLTDA